MNRVCQAAALIAITASGNAFAAPRGPETVLADASRYTVKVQVLNEIGFTQDPGGSGFGTGFVIDLERGWILTNAHVATRSPSSIKVSFKDGKPIAAKRIHVDPVIDLAVLSVPPKSLPASAREAILACEGLPRAGTSVLAYGHPWGLSFTASRGIVSGLAWFYPNHLIQTDATINSGNSGGPLISIADGRVLGLNTSTYQPDSENGGASAISLATPMPGVCKIIELLRKGEDTRLRMLPVTVATSGDDLRPRVARPLSGHSDFIPGDIIKSVNGGRTISSFAELLADLRGLGAEATVLVDRKGQLIQVQSPLSVNQDPLKVRAINLSGMIIAEPWRVDDFEFNPDHNLTIHWIKSGEDAALTEAKAFDYISSVDGKSFQTVDALYAYLEGLPPEEMVEIILRRISSANEFHREYHHVEIRRNSPEWVYAEK